MVVSIYLHHAFSAEIRLNAELIEWYIFLNLLNHIVRQ